SGFRKQKNGAGVKCQVSGVRCQVLGAPSATAQDGRNPSKDFIPRLRDHRGHGEETPAKTVGQRTRNGNLVIPARAEVLFSVVAVRSEVNLFFAAGEEDGPGAITRRSGNQKQILLPQGGIRMTCHPESTAAGRLKEVVWQLPALSISNRQSKIGNPRGRFRCKLGSCLPVSPRQRSRHEDTTDSIAICPASSRRIVCVRP